MRRWIIISLVVVAVLLVTVTARHHHATNDMGTSDANCVSAAVCAA
jgi:hypothetical protein